VIYWKGGKFLMKFFTDGTERKMRWRGRGQEREKGWALDTIRIGLSPYEFIVDICR
jgi:hypothetical protein